MRRPIATVVLVSALLASPALAATGLWQCRESREYNGNLASSSEVRSFEMAVYGNGAVEGGGMVQILNGGAFRYSFPGRWQTPGADFLWVGTSSIGGGAQMTFQSRVLDDLRMAASWIDPATGTRISTVCDRLQ